MKAHKTIALTLVTIGSLLLNGSTPPGSGLLERELTELTKRGLTYRIVDGSDCSTCGKGQWVEVHDPRTAVTNRFPLDPLLTPRQATYTALPTLTIDLTALDTNLYNWKYNYLSSLPLSGGWGFALQVDDLNGEGRSEAYGEYYTQSEYGSRVYEFTDSNSWVFRASLPNYIGWIDNIADIDQNGLKEIYGHRGDSLHVFEQSSPTIYPLVQKFRFRQWYFSAAGIPNAISDVLNDGNKQLLYRGSEPDSQTTNVQKVYVAEYDSMVNNFRPVWGRQLPPGCVNFCTLNTVAGDFDGDGRREFVTSAFEGNTYIVEHVAADSFAVVWSDSLSTAGRVASGDVDGNGVEEFFVGGSQSEPDGYVHMRIYAYERTGDNQYQPVFAFNIYPVSTFFVDLFQTADVDADGQRELLLSVAGGVLILKGVGDHNYALFYYKQVSSLDGIACARVDTNRTPALFISRRLIAEPVINQTQVYRLDSVLAGVSELGGESAFGFTLKQNYPNPFNPSTTISYKLTDPSFVTVIVFDVTGKEVTTLVQEEQLPGTHNVTWNGEQEEGGKKMASGIYFYQVTVKGKSLTKKMLLLK